MWIKVIFFQKYESKTQKRKQILVHFELIVNNKCEWRQQIENIISNPNLTNMNQVMILFTLTHNPVQFLDR